MSMKIIKTVFLKAPREQVWRFLTQPDLLAQWFHPGAGELVPGGDWTMLSNDADKQGQVVMTGTVLEMKEPELLVHSFTHEWIGGAQTTCTWTLQEVEGGTVLMLVHDGWENVADGAFGAATDHDKGWEEHLPRLRALTNPA